MHRHTHKQNQPRKFTSIVFERDVFKYISLLPSINQKVLTVQLVLIKLLLHFKAHHVSLYSGNMLVHRKGKQSSSHWHQLHFSTSSPSLLLEDELSEALKHFHKEFGHQAASEAGAQ